MSMEEQEALKQIAYEIAKRDKKLLKRLQVVYSTLHLSGAYDGSRA